MAYYSTFSVWRNWEEPYILPWNAWHVWTITFGSEKVEISEHVYSNIYEFNSNISRMYIIFYIFIIKIVSFYNYNFMSSLQNY